MPEIPGLGIEDPGRSQPQRVAKGVIAEQVTDRANVLGGSELHELAEQEVRPRERLGGRQPPGIASRKLDEGVSAHESISSEIARSTTSSTRSAGRIGGARFMAFADLGPMAMATWLDAGVRLLIRAGLGPMPGAARDQPSRLHAVEDS